MIIYKTTNLINNKIYVGKHNENSKHYLGSGWILHKAIEKYGRENFIRETIEVVNEQNWREREIFWIKELNARDQNIGYNICAGGEGGPITYGADNPSFGKGSDRFSDKGLKSLKTKAIERMKLQKYRDAASTGRRGKKDSDETKQKKSDARLGNKNPAAKEVIVEGVKYTTLRHASKETGLSLYHLRKLL
jgi:group I intron endonuclease